MDMKSRVRQILADLEGVRESLLALSDDIWLNVDHNDSSALKRAVAFKLSYNDKMDSFNRSAQDVSTILQQFVDVPIETPVQIDVRTNGRARDDLQRGVAGEPPHGLRENFEYTRPSALALQGRAYTGLVTWRRTYEIICRQLAGNDPERFAALPHLPTFMGRQGKPAFSTDPGILIAPIEVVGGIYAEGCLSANQIRNRVQALLREFGIPEQDIQIYLRDDVRSEHRR